MPTRWSAIKPEGLESTRLKLDLMLGRAIRHFNEISFPGIGNVSFVRQLTWSVMGLALAEKSGERPMKVAEAVEALACYIALFRSNNKKDYADSNRIQGKRNLDENRGCSYKVLCNRVNYVSQPFRVGTTAALVDLNLAKGSRRLFNSLELTLTGRSLANILLEKNDGKTKEWLLKNWMILPVKTQIPEEVKESLLPGYNETDKKGASKNEKDLVREHLYMNSDRVSMINALKSIKNPPGEKGGLGSQTGKDILINNISNETQKKNIVAAYMFEDLRDSALALVRILAKFIMSGPVALINISESTEVRDQLNLLETKSNQLVKYMAMAGIIQDEASLFCKELQNSEYKTRLRSFINRLPGVIVCSGEIVSRGHLLQPGSFEQTYDQAIPPNNIKVPTPGRLFSAYRLIKDVNI